MASFFRRQFKGNVSYADKLNGAITNTATTFSLTDGSTFPDGSVGPFVVTMDADTGTEEKILCQSRTGSVFTVATNGRGWDNTTAVGHASGASVIHSMSAVDLDEANNAVSQTIGLIQASGDLLVGSALNTLVRLAKGANGTYLGVAGNAVGWQSSPVNAAAVEALFTADQQIFSGTGNGTGELIDLQTALGEYFASAGQVFMGTGAGTGALTTLPRKTSITSSATPSINCDTTDLYEITALAATITGVTVTGTPHDGQKLVVRIKDNGTPQTITWGTSFMSSGIATLMTTTPTGKQSTSGFMYDSAQSKWVLLALDSTGY